jgi:hypothetical protein
MIMNNQGFLTSTVTTPVAASSDLNSAAAAAAETTTATTSLHLLHPVVAPIDYWHKKVVGLIQPNGFVRLGNYNKN